MNELPKHGRIDCTLCYPPGPIVFDHSRHQEGSWRITANPLAWGNSRPQIVVLGFSKGPSAAGAIANGNHSDIAYRKKRKNVGKILRHVGLIEGVVEDHQLDEVVSQLISEENGRFHFGSFVRCAVERLEGGIWKGSGGGMLDKFVATPFGERVASNCATRFLGDLPPSVQLVVLFGLGSEGNYVRAARSVIQRARGVRLRTINDVAYADEEVTFVHVEHFASLGALIPNWLGENKHERARLGELARSAVQIALASSVADSLQSGGSSLETEPQKGKFISGAPRATYCKWVMNALMALGPSTPGHVYEWIRLNEAVPAFDLSGATADGNSLFEKNVRWARFDLWHQGLVVSPKRGVWALKS